MREIDARKAADDGVLDGGIDQSEVSVCLQVSPQDQAPWYRRLVTAK